MLLKVCVGILAGIGLITLVVVLLFGSRAHYFNQKYDNGMVAVGGQRSAYLLRMPQPIWQEEPHTCGYLSVSSIYHSYGLDPEQRNVRFRIGVDTRGNMFDERSLGSIHPDIFRVMYQDGFVLADVDLASSRAHTLLMSHLYMRHAVLLLIKRPQSGNLHWVCAVDPRDGSDDVLHVIDSLEREPYLVDAHEFVDQHVVSALLVYRPRSPETIDALTLNSMGIASAAAALDRM